MLKKIINFSKKRDFKFFVYEKFSKFIGHIGISINKLIYQSRLEIIEPYKVWGLVRIIINGTGKISIGKNFYAVSDKKRSMITLFTPCSLNIIDDGKIIIGDHVGINGTTIVSRDKIILGDNCMIGPNTIIIDHDGHDLWPVEKRWEGKGKSEPIKIGNNVWIGMNSMILKGVTIGDGTVIAAGSVIVKNCDNNSLYAGNPAKKIKKLD